MNLKIKGEPGSRSSLVLEGNILVETVYDPKEGKSCFAVSYPTDSGRAVVMKDRLAVDTGGREVVITPTVTPLSAADPMVREGFIKLPSAVGEYVNVQGLYQEILDFIRRYAHLPSDFAQVAAMYVLMSWVYERFDVVAFLRVIGFPGTGKTRVLKTIGNIAYKGTLVSGSATSASIFRTVNDLRGTFAIDEADFRSSELWDGIVKILNSGHTRDLPVIRMEKVGKNSEFVTKTFNVFGPKVLASRERYKDNALESRCISQELWPVKKLEVPIHLDEEFDSTALALRNKLLRFRFDHFYAVKVDDKHVAALTLPRMKQTFLALATIAAFVGEQTFADISAFAVRYERSLISLMSQTTEVDAVICLKKLINRGKQKIYVKEVTRLFNDAFAPEYSERREDSSGFQQNYLELSDRKMGSILDKLMLRKERDRDGYYLAPSEFEKVDALVERFGITPEMIAEETRESTDLTNIRADEVPGGYKG